MASARSRRAKVFSGGTKLLSPYNRIGTFRRRQARKPSHGVKLPHPVMNSAAS